MREYLLLPLFFVVYVGTRERNGVRLLVVESVFVVQRDVGIVRFSSFIFLFFFKRDKRIQC